MSKKDNLAPCPKCGGEFVDIWKTVFSRKYHCECRKCYYAGRGSRFLFLAKKRWNKEEIFEDEKEN
jgi:hypothetical protein